MEGLVRCAANYIPLTPISFIERAATVYGDTVSIIYGSSRYSWRETHQRCLKLASALSFLGISPGDVVAAVAPNILPLYELHFGVPMAGAVLSALNPRLDAATLPLILKQLDPKIVFADREYIAAVVEAVAVVYDAGKRPVLVLISGLEKHSNSDQAPEKPASSRSFDYNQILELGRSDFKVFRPDNECDPISVNFTSGSTGIPKGAVYSHRAAYLNSIAQIFRCEMGRRPPPVFLWTVDMFRCNGWCFAWAMAAVGGTNVCIRSADAGTILEAISAHGITNFCGSPVILDLITEEASRRQLRILRKVDVFVAGALPPKRVLEKMEELGFNVSNGYGMTEALGPATATMIADQNGDRNRREEIHSVFMEGVDVRDPRTMKSVGRDGKETGEIMLRGNCLMSGYLKRPGATAEAFEGGWYRTGDLGVKHPDGYVEMKDRIRDAIFCSGGEALSTLEVEGALLCCEKVSKAAVVGKFLGGGSGSGSSGIREEATPCAFVELKEGCYASAEEMIEFCGEMLPAKMVPRNVVFGALPMTSTGKVQKFALREKAKSVGLGP